MLRKSVTELRDDIGTVINQVCFGGERAVIHRRGRDCVAIVSIDDLDILKRIEDLIDIREAEKALNEKGERPFDYVLRDLGL